MSGSQTPAFIDLTRLFNKETGGFDAREYTVNTATIHKIEDAKAVEAGRAWVTTEDDGLILVQETRAEINKRIRTALTA